MRSLVSLMLMGALIWPGVVGAHAQGEQRPIDWYAVRCSRPGDELLITARGGRPIVRYFLQADDASITVLNLASPPLPWRAARPAGPRVQRSRSIRALPIAGLRTSIGPQRPSA